MNIAGLSSVLLFCLSIPIVIKYRILPIEGTPYWLFGVLFLCLIAHAVVTFILSESRGAGESKKKSAFIWMERLRILFFVGALGISLGGATITAIVDRNRVAPVWGVHDIILQQEAAIRYLITGKNPYKETYFGTPVESFHYDEQGKPATNPALYHFVMPPWYLLFPIPWYYIANHTVGYFDGRMVSVLAMGGIILLLFSWFKNTDLGLLAIILMALSPATVDYFIEGRSDIFALFWLLFALFLLNKKKYTWSAVSMGLAVISKQTMWFAFPLWVVYMWSSRHSFSRKREKNMFWFGMYMVVAMGVAGIFTFPFLLWDWHAFLDSVVFYLSRGGETGYPVSGYGLSMILYDSGIIKNLHDYFPFAILQLVIGVPALVATSFWFLQSPRVSRWFIAYSLVLFAVWYGSRYFNNSHIAFISSIFMLGLLKQYDEYNGDKEP